MLDPKVKTLVLEMTPEKMLRAQKLCMKITFLLRQHTDSPLEAFLVLHLLTHSFAQLCGVEGGSVIERVTDIADNISTTIH
jgi:hypothetical protein